MERLEVTIGSFELTVTPTPERPLRADYLSDSREVVVLNIGPPPLVIRQGEQVLVLEFQEIAIRLSEDAVRQLAEMLPPETLH